jgi:hypothetical protein
MTLEDLENTLPNGLHDAEVQRIEVDYALRKLTLEVAVRVGDMGEPPERREAYKSARIEISTSLSCDGAPGPKVSIPNFRLANRWLRYDQEP